MSDDICIGLLNCISRCLQMIFFIIVLQIYAINKRTYETTKEKLIIQAFAGRPMHSSIIFMVQCLFLIGEMAYVKRDKEVGC